MKFYKIKTLLVSLIIGLLPQFAMANSDEEAKSFIQDTSSQVISVLESSSSSSEKEAKLTSLFVNVMDIDWIGKFSLGKYWTKLSDEEKINYLKVYRKYLISSYVPLFKKYNKQKLIIKSIKPLVNDQYTLITQIKNENDGQSYNVEYRLKYSNDRFKVRDIIAEGVSLLSTQRSEFASIMGQGDINILNEKLMEKNIRKDS